MPAWYGVRYPHLDDLEDHALRLGTAVKFGNFPAPACLWDGTGPLVIFVPNYSGNLARVWALSHELGHLTLHHGPIRHSHSRHEAEADSWAVRALIPEARIQCHQNASVGSFMAALWRHYQEYGQADDGVRRLAARIAYTRLGCMQEDGAREREFGT